METSTFRVRIYVLKGADMKRLAVLLVAALMCVDWVRFTGTVKAINLKASTLTIQVKDGDLITIPIDYQVKIADKGGDIRSLKDIQLDQKVTLTRTPAEMPRDDSEVESLQEPSQRGR